MRGHSACTFSFFFGGGVQYASTRHIVEKIKQIQSILVGFVTDLAIVKLPEKMMQEDNSF